MNSMTGYGRGEATTADLSVVIELKSVNHRFRDINLRAPREYGALEPRIAALLKTHFSRGRIDCFVRRVATGGPQRVTPNLSLAEATYRAMREVAQRLGRPESDVRLEDVFSHPLVAFGRVSCCMIQLPVCARLQEDPTLKFENIGFPFRFQMF